MRSVFRLLTHRGRAALLGLTLALTAGVAAQAQEAAIRKNLLERLPTLPKIEEVSKTPMNGLFEVRVSGNDIYYTDADGSFLIQGQGRGGRRGVMAQGAGAA